MVVFASDRDGNYEIYVMYADGSSESRLTTNTTDENYSTVSPDWITVAYESNRGGDYEIIVRAGDYEIIVRAGGFETNHTNNAEYDIHPAFSPDGTKITFISGRDGNDEVYVMNADGTDQTNLSNNSARDIVPDWSPDSARITFTRYGKSNYDIYSVNASDGSGQ